MVLCTDDSTLLKARISARLATAQMLIPAKGSTYLQDARASVEAALETLCAQGNPSEIAEAEMNYGGFCKILLPRIKPVSKIVLALTNAHSYL